MIDNPLNRIHVKRGSQLPQAKLDEQKVAEILALIAEREELKKKLAGMTNEKIAQRYGVCLRTIDRISGFFGWTHVTTK